MKTKKGFSLIELMVVMSIIAVLSALGILAINIAKNQATNTKRVAAMRELEVALSAYRAKTGEYPKYDSTEVDCTDVAHELGVTNEAACAAANKNKGLQKFLIDRGYLSSKNDGLTVLNIFYKSNGSKYTMVACDHKTTSMDGRGILNDGSGLDESTYKVCNGTGAGKAAVTTK